ncbi:DUF1835 domain-containing protein [Snuella lapsa]|uniref:DUF1835 domain-containing protein n=1 Tax=Snuella lapsa TaxID=870481 RepID=A0ABP6YF25_9FLAO
MDTHALHITNGTVLTNYLNDLGIVGEKLTWEEMLCEGPTLESIYSKDFLSLRSSFFKDFYEIDLDYKKILREIDKLNHPEMFTEINLWFEYDLFCHINMIAVINLLNEKKIEHPIYLICSGRIEESKNLKGLSELTPKQLTTHYKERTKLKREDIDLAKTIWRIYCGKDHNLLKPYIVTASSFKYLSNCLKAHLKRFPDSKSGLTTLEENILKLVRDHPIKSKHHLLGYAINYQGYYGFGDLQLARIIDNLSFFFTENEERLNLNRSGHEALLGHHSFYNNIADNMFFGGVKKRDFRFSKPLNKLVKQPIDVD